MNYKQRMRVAVIIIGVLLMIVGAGDKLAPLHPAIAYAVAVGQVTAFISGAVCIVAAVRHG